MFAQIYVNKIMYANILCFIYKNSVYKLKFKLLFYNIIFLRILFCSFCFLKINSKHKFLEQKLTRLNSQY